MTKIQSYEGSILKHKNCAVIVAHPDDETLWCGGLILMNPQVQWTIITLCRRNDPDRLEKFHKVMKKIGATGVMGDIDDGPEQIPLHLYEVRCAISELLPSENFDLIITHSPDGEYTRHRRHEEVGKAVVSLWKDDKLFSKELWQFAYEDNCGHYKPRPIKNADLIIKLPNEIWQTKYEIITDIYGFTPHGFEAKAATKEEAFWRFTPTLQIAERNK
jgi:LmbE family N-acetylglucosaminyl deacetylase